MGTKLEKKIHHSTINNKCAKINIGEMGMEGKKKESKAQEMYRGKGSDFEMKEREY